MKETEGYERPYIIFIRIGYNNNRNNAKQTNKK